MSNGVWYTRNIFVPQSLATQIELEDIADVTLQVISPGSSTPIIGLVQDGLLGAYNLTASDMRIDWQDMMNIMSYTTIGDLSDSTDLSSIKKNKDYTGHELFSMIIPNKISISGKVEVKNGELIKGQLTKSQLGAGAANSLIHLIWDEYGVKKTQEFIDNSQRLVNNFNLVNCFTVGIGDIAIKESVEKELHTFFETKKVKFDHLITEIENNPDLYDVETFEAAIFSEANTILDKSSQLIMKNMEPKNNFNIMISSKSKGKPVNMGQMSGCVGQQHLEGSRIKKKVNNRTLAFFHQNDDSAVARGFVGQPYVYGLTPESFIFHNISSREGIIDTAIKTSSSGYIQRKLIKSLEDAKITYDMTVRNANNTILQFSYGDSGIDTTKQSIHKFNMILMGNKEVAAKYRFTPQELKSYPKFTEKLNQDYYNNLLRMRDSIRASTRKISLDYIFMNNSFMLPVNMNRIINNTKEDRELKSSGSDKLTPNYILDKLDDILEYSSTKLLALSTEDAKNKDSLKYQDELTSKTMLQFALHEFLSPKVCIQELKLNKSQFDSIFDQIVTGYNKSVVEPGEMVGVLAAQSVGEPVTQLVLNSLDWEDKIIISENDEIIISEIGKYIDREIKRNKTKVIRLEDNTEDEMGDTYYLDTKDKNIKAISVDKEGKISWNKVEALTKHLPINKDGTDDLVKITTKSGRQMTATKAKSFLTIYNKMIRNTRGDEIKVGDLVPVFKDYPGEIKMTLEAIREYNKYDNSFNESLKDVYCDKIIKVELVKPTHKYVYDMTVENDKTFALHNGLLCYDTFHSAGISAAGTATLGVPRARELLSLSKNMKTPRMLIYLNKDVRENRDVADKIASNIKYSNIATVRQRVDIYYDPNPLSEEGFMKRDNVFNVFHKHKPTKNSCQSSIDNLPWLMRIVLDKEKMMEKEITLLDIKAKFCNFWERRYMDTKGFKKDDKKILEKIPQCAILSNSNNDVEPVIHLRFDMKNFSFSTVTTFLDMFVENLKLKGISDVDNIEGIDDSKTTDYDNEDQAIIDSKELVVVTAGVNLGKLRYINGIDINKTRCNDIVKTYQLFGIEAARALLYKEFNTVFSGGGVSVNFQHLSILIDLMTNTGGLTSIDRHGLSKLDTDPLSRASFERPVLQLIEAAVFSEVDTMKSVSSRIMAGMVIKGGTGMCDVVMDTDTLERSEFIEDIEQKYHKTFNELDTDTVMDDIVSKPTSGIFIPV
jgi:DNA-directed RNA polymerase beta' subunit